MPIGSVITVRAERADDRGAIRAVHRAAFGRDDESDLVDRLRTDPAYLAALSLVAECDGRVVGHIMLTRARVECAVDAVEALALAPMGVLPRMQRRGVGAALVHRALAEAENSGHQLVIVLGHAAYYPRFGFKVASMYGIGAPFPVPDEAFLAVWLGTARPRVLNGTLRYAAPFEGLS